MNFVTKEPINKGWSSDKNFFVQEETKTPKNAMTAEDVAKMKY